MPRHQMREAELRTCQEGVVLSEDSQTVQDLHQNCDQWDSKEEPILLDSSCLAMLACLSTRFAHLRL